MTCCDTLNPDICMFVCICMTCCDTLNLYICIYLYDILLYFGSSHLHVCMHLYDMLCSFHIFWRKVSTRGLPFLICQKNLLDFFLFLYMSANNICTQHYCIFTFSRTWMHSFHYLIWLSALMSISLFPDVPLS